MSKKTLLNQSGYTLIELSIGLAIVSLTIAAVVSGVQRLLEQTALNKTVKQINIAAEEIRSIIRKDATTDYVSDINLTDAKSNAFAAFSVTGDRTNPKIWTALGNLVKTDSSYNGAPTSSQHFRIGIRETKPSYCADLVYALEGTVSRILIWETAAGAYREVKTPVSSLNTTSVRAYCSANSGFIVLEYLK